MGVKKSNEIQLEINTSGEYSPFFCIAYKIEFYKVDIIKPIQGTCFFIGIKGEEYKHVYVITAAHLISEDTFRCKIFLPKRRKEAVTNKELKFSEEIIEEDIILSSSKSPNWFRAHTESYDVDLAGIIWDKDLDEEISPFIINIDIIEDGHISVNPVNRLVITGFPIGLGLENSAWGLSREATLATPLSLDLPGNSYTNNLKIPGFIVDGHFHEGMSGAPILLLDHWFYENEELIHHMKRPPGVPRRLIGIFIGPYGPQYDLKEKITEGVGSPSLIQLGIGIRGSIIKNFIEQIHEKQTEASNAR